VDSSESDSFDSSLELITPCGWLASFYFIKSINPPIKKIKGKTIDREKITHQTSLKGGLYIWVIKSSNPSIKKIKGETIDVEKITHQTSLKGGFYI